MVVPVFVGNILTNTGITICPIPNFLILGSLLFEIVNKSG